MLSEVAESAANSQPISREEEQQLSFKPAPRARLCNVSDSIPVCMLLWLSAVPAVRTLVSAFTACPHGQSPAHTGFCPVPF